jgi:hypothetical protein
MATQTIFRKIGDDAVKAKTGKNWKQWISILNKFNVKKNGHRLAVKFLATRYKIGPWWSQAVAIYYEWVRGLRTVKNQRQARPKDPLFVTRKRKSKK